MILFATHFAKHATIRLEEVGFALGAIAGALLLFSAMTPLGRRGGQALAGLALAAGSVVLVVALHWGSI
jgi:hypothetical protein